MISFQIILQKKYLTVFVIAATLISLIFSNIYTRSSIIGTRNSSLFIFPSIISLAISVHCIIEYALDYLFKYELLTRARCLQLIGSLVSNILLVVAITGIFSLHPTYAFMLLQMQSILVLISLNAFLEQLLRQEAMGTLTLIKVTYIFSVSLICVSSVGCAMKSPSKLPVEIVLVVLSYLCITCMIGAFYYWFKHSRNLAITPTAGLNMKPNEMKFFLAVAAISYTVYLIGIIFYSLSLNFNGILCAQQMTAMMLYLNCFCAYVVFLKDGLTSRLLQARIQVTMNTTKKTELYCITDPSLTF